VNLIISALVAVLSVGSGVAAHDSATHAAHHLTAGGSISPPCSEMLLAKAHLLEHIVSGKHIHAALHTYRLTKVGCHTATVLASGS
jgi:hypothetical protein